jgi:hypothetical protein
MFMIGLILGAGAVWVISSVNSLNGAISPLSGLSNYFKGIPPINTTTQVTGP